eukprot:GHVQ01009553.1.p1 GENE.GHVQ01009553.1~~GHVQ01009553.1.p1  ORF type:complete len:118 (+),score=9.76 GHVQ01009553.1:535-888(+)
MAKLSQMLLLAMALTVAFQVSLTMTTVYAEDIVSETDARNLQGKNNYQTYTYTPSRYYHRNKYSSNRRALSSLKNQSEEQVSAAITQTAASRNLQGRHHPHRPCGCRAIWCRPSCHH